MTKRKVVALRAMKKDGNPLNQGAVEVLDALGLGAESAGRNCGHGVIHCLKPSHARKVCSDRANDGDAQVVEHKNDGSMLDSSLIKIGG